MKSRLAVTTMLVLGLVLSTGGGGLAITGISSDGSAGKAQYAAPEDRGGTLGEERRGVEDGAEPTADEGAPAGEDDGAPAAGQPGRQVELAEGRDRLPFSGLAAIPLLVGGVGLLVTGFTLRRRAG